jgi:hypothetical protein
LTRVNVADEPLQCGAMFVFQAMLRYDVSRGIAYVVHHSQARDEFGAGSRREDVAASSSAGRLDEHEQGPALLLVRGEALSQWRCERVKIAADGNGPFLRNTGSLRSVDDLCTSVQCCTSSAWNVTGIISTRNPGGIQTGVSGRVL